MPQKFIHNGSYMVKLIFKSWIKSQSQDIFKMWVLKGTEIYKVNSHVNTETHLQVFIVLVFAVSILCLRH